MGDIDRENQASSPVQITGGDEAYKADVIVQDGKRLKVDAFISGGEVEVNSRFRIIESQADVDINDTTYTTIYSNTAEAVMSGFMTKANTSDYFVKITVDGEVIMEVDTSFLKFFADWNSSANPASWVTFNNGPSNAFYFLPTIPMKIETDILVECKTKTGNKKIEGYYIQVAEL